MTPKELEKVRAYLINSRRRPNVTNPERTDYYLNYWRDRPEVPWAFLAHLVSRNAGYQMSDLVRFRRLARMAVRSASLGVPLPGVPHPVLEILLKRGLAQQLSGLFMLLEVGNFLIFYDVYPQLEVYRIARTMPADSEQLFDLLRHPAFDVDPFIIAEWKAFFAIVTQRAPTALEVQRHVFALIVNEQNQIEDRLLRDHGQYLRSLGRTVNRMMDLAEMLKATELCFPKSGMLSFIAEKLLLYTVTGFRSLEKRIKTGKDLFVGLFDGSSPNGEVLNWVQARIHHRGTRRDYNRADYSLDPITIIPGGHKYSPPLVPASYEGGAPRVWRTHKAVWYDPPPATSPLFRHIYGTPLPLRIDGGGPPLPVALRPEFTATWLDPPMNPTPLTSTNPGEMKEVLL